MENVSIPGLGTAEKEHATSSPFLYGPLEKKSVRKGVTSPCWAALAWSGTGEAACGKLS